MTTGSRVVTIALIVAAIGAAGCEAQKPMLVSCTTGSDHIDVVGLDLRHQRATLLSVSPPLNGTAHASPTEYEVDFQPGPDGASRLRIEINRYTLRMTRELAPHPVEGGVPNSPPSTGVCERYKGKPL